MKHNSLDNSQTQVIVVGAGAAGLSAAFRLKQTGFAVKLIEADEEVGGKLRSRQRDGFTIDTGAYFMPTRHRKMVALAAEAGFADQIDPGGSVLSIARDGQLHELDIDHALRDFVNTRLFSTGTKLSMLSLAGAVITSRNGSFNKTPRLGRFDAESADDWAARRLNDELREYIVGNMLRGMSATGPAGASRVEFLTHLNTLIGTKLVACRGGMGAYAQRLAAGIDVALGAWVEEVSQQGGGVRVVWRDRHGVENTEQVAACVIAGPTQTVLDVWPELDDWRREYLGRAPAKPMCTVNVGLPSPPKGINALYTLIPHSVHHGLSGIGFDHNKAPGRVPDGKGMIALVPVIQWAEELTELDDDRIIEETFKAADTVIPGVVSNVEFAQVNRWPTRFNPISHYRDLGHFRELCEKKDSVIQLAGDYFGYANLESAFISGDQAANRLVALMQP